MAIEKVEPKYFDLLCGHYEWLAEWESPSNCPIPKVRPVTVRVYA
jgi:hypothetical protein